MDQVPDMEGSAAVTRQTPAAEAAVTLPEAGEEQQGQKGRSRRRGLHEGGSTLIGQGGGGGGGDGMRVQHQQEEEEV